MNVCKFCGAKRAEAAFHSYMAAYYCGSWHDGSRHWSQGIACRDRCEKIRVHLEQTIEILRKRVAKAIEATQQANRFDLVAGRHGGIDAESDSAGCYAWASVLDDIAAILQGNSPEIPEGST